jgi:hypothetical protein
MDSSRLIPALTITLRPEHAEKAFQDALVFLIPAFLSFLALQAEAKAVFGRRNRIHC